jgi:hypothetical protein
MQVRRTHLKRWKNVQIQILKIQIQIEEKMVKLLTEEKEENTMKK